VSPPPHPQALQRVLRVLLVVYVLNFLDRQIVNILAEPIRRELGLSDTQIGLMTGIAFAAFYTLLGLPIARFADRASTDRVRLIAWAMAIWSAMTAICGLAQNFVQLLLARIGVGVGEAGCTPAAHSLIADLAGPDKRASAMAFYSLGIPLGSLLGMLIGGLLADAYGWRTAFLVVAAPGILLACVLPRLIRDPRGAHALAGPRAAASGAVSASAALGEMFVSRAFVLTVAAGTAASFLSYGKTTWATIFFQRTHGLSAGDTGLWFGVGGGLAAIAGTWLGGWLADRYGRHQRRHVMTAPAIGMLLAVPLALAGYHVEDWRAAMLLLLLPQLLNSLYYGPVYSSVQGLVRPPLRALASAVLLFAQNLVGLGLGPLLFGVLSDFVRPLAGEDSVRWVLYCAALLGLLPALLFWRASLRLDAALDRAQT
jgi:MFS family permease